MTAPPSIAVSGISKHFGPTTALADVSFAAQPGQVHALCGHNGAGKSTLVRVLSGSIVPDSGSIVIAGEPVELSSPADAQRFGVAVVDQELSLVGCLSIEDNLALGGVDEPFWRGRARASRFESALERVGLDDLSLSTSVERLPIGQRQLLELARALHRGARTLILDEPTATLSRAESELVFRAIRKTAESGCAVILVSHRLDDIFRVSDQVTVMRDARVVSSGPLKGLSRSSLIKEMVGEEVISQDAETGAIVPSGVAMSIQSLEVPGSVESFDLELGVGEVVGLAGQVGAGASEVLRALAGLESVATGSVTVGSNALRLGSPGRSANAGLEFVSNDRKSEGLFLGQSVQRNLLATRLPAVTRLGCVRDAQAGGIARGLAASVALDTEAVERPADQLSGGNQQKVFVGRCLDKSEGATLLLDEPTRGVDVRGRAEIHEIVRAVARAGGAVLFASTDLDEILALSSRVVTMYEGRVVSDASVTDCDAKRLLAEMTHASETAPSDQPIAGKA